MGAWLDEMRSLTSRRYGRVRVVIAVDAVHDPEGSVALATLGLLTPVGRVGVSSAADLERVGRALGQLRCEVVIIDRVSGRVLGDGRHLERGATGGLHDSDRDSPHRRGLARALAELGDGPRSMASGGACWSHTMAPSGAALAAFLGGVSGVPHRCAARAHALARLGRRHSARS